MVTIAMEGGTLFASVAERIITGLLLPFGEVGNTNVGKVLVASGTVELPTDLSILNLNEGHAQTEPRGRITTITETPQGLMASFAIGKTTEGDTLLASVDAASRGEGAAPALSVELANVVVRAGKVIKAKLSGAAIVTKGAFPSASIFAADAGETPAAAPAQPAAWSAGTLIAQQAPQAPAAVVTERPEALFAAFVDAATRARQGDSAAFDNITVNAGNLFAAFAVPATADIKYDAAGSPGNAARLPAWLGELWSGDTRGREFIDLLGTPGTLTSLNAQGWRWKTKPTVHRWDGNLANIQGTKAETEPYTTKAQRFAGGNSLAIEYQHFGENEMIAAVLRMQAESYAEVSDAYALELALAQARLNEVEVEAGPSHVVPSLVRIVRGARRMRAAKARASFALVSENDYEEFLWTTNETSLAHLSASFGLEEGQAVENRIVPRPELEDGETIMIDRRAFQILELPGVPIRVNALDIARGGLDDALFGYIGHRVDFPAGLQTVTTGA